MPLNSLQSKVHPTLHGFQPDGTSPYGLELGERLVVRLVQMSTVERFAIDTDHEAAKQA